MIKIDLNDRNICEFRDWLGVDEGRFEKVLGLKEGTKNVLEALGIYNNVIGEIAIEKVITQQQLDKLNEEIKYNKIRAVYNLGYASGMYWCLVELGVSKDKLKYKGELLG